MFATQATGGVVLAETNTREYFRDTVTAAVVNQGIDADESTLFYIVNLLDYFSHSDRLFEQTSEGLRLEPLALLYAKAVQASNLEEQQSVLRRLGDVALLIAGFFPDSLNGKAVDIDYYVGMGRSAYGYLSDTAHKSTRSQALRGIFTELAEKFQKFVDVLAEVGESRAPSLSLDILRLYEVSQKTGSTRVADKLRQAGVQPFYGNISQRKN